MKDTKKSKKEQKKEKPKIKEDKSPTFFVKPPREQKNIVFISSYKIKEDAPLYIELKKKVNGFGFCNSLYYISELFKKSEINSRTLTFKDLCAQDQLLLEQNLQKGFMIGNPKFANRKSSLILKHQDQLFYNSTDSVILYGDMLKSYDQLAKKWLISSKCLIGRRTRANRKRHGQRTKTTGRTKVLKGFQKRKIIAK